MELLKDSWFVDPIILPEMTESRYRGGISAYQCRLVASLGWNFEVADSISNSFVVRDVRIQGRDLLQKTKP